LWKTAGGGKVSASEMRDVKPIVCGDQDLGEDGVVGVLDRQTAA